MQFRCMFFQISLQMQQLLEPSLHPDSWSPVKIRFNWDASYWTKHISSLGKMNIVEASLSTIVLHGDFSPIQMRIKMEGPIINLIA